MAKSNEPLWWAPFMIGAVISAFLMPITIVIVGILTFCAWINDRELWHILQNPWVRAYLGILIVFSLFHGFHRILYILIDLGFKDVRRILAVILYGCAIAGTIVTILLGLHVFPGAQPAGPSSPPQRAVSRSASTALIPPLLPSDQADVGSGGELGRSPGR
jgi:fumarate reductase subunit D